MSSKHTEFEEQAIEGILEKYDLTTEDIKQDEKGNYIETWTDSGNEGDVGYSSRVVKLYLKDLIEKIYE